MDIKEEDILRSGINTHWYYRAKFFALRSHIADFNFRHILDVGAGSGFFSRELLTHTQAWDALCIDTSYPCDRDEHVGGKTIQFRTQCSRTEANLVLLMDVLEHVDDDCGLLAEYARKVPDGAHFFITVPAFQFLWSGHDVFLEHRRRYRLPELEKVVKEAGLEILRGSYFYATVFPLAAAMRLSEKLSRRPDVEPRSGLRMHHPLVNGTLAACCRAEILFHKANRLAGLTAVCVAKKPNRIA